MEKNIRLDIYYHSNSDLYRPKYTLDTKLSESVNVRYFNDFEKTKQLLIMTTIQKVFENCL